MNTVKEHANQIRSISDARVVWTAAALLESLAKLLQYAKCPNDCVDGVFCNEVPGYDGEGDIEVIECQWCYERNAYLQDNQR